MKYRAVANGEIREDVPVSLVEAGIYVPVKSDEMKADTKADEQPKRRKPHR